MKNKKSLLALGLLALVLVLGVGYAAVTAVGLNFEGTATVGEADLRVDIESVTEVSTVTDDTKATVEHSLTSHGNADKFTISGMNLNEEVTITYTVKNHETDVAANLTEAVALTNTNSQYFNATYSITTPELAAGAETTVVVKVKLVKTPVVEANNSTTISFKLNATPVNNAN